MAVAYKDYYATLGVPRTATTEDIKKAHRKLVREHHPDLNPGDKQAEAKFKDIQEAYEVLSNAENRKRYDELGANWKSGAEFRPPPGWQPSSADFGNGAGHADYSRFGGGDFSDFFESLFAGRGGPRGRGGGGGATYRIRGQDLEAEVAITLEEAHRGTSRRLTLEIDEPCPECGGTGIANNKPCPACGGRGTRPGHKTLEVKIPAGVRDETVLRLARQGEPGAGGAPAGDLLVHIRLLPHARFRVEGDDNLVTELPVAPWEAVLGARIVVDTLDGKIELTMPPGSQTGRRLRLRERGLRRRGGGSGDLFVVLKVVVPTNPTPEERELFQQLANISKFIPRQ